jgi:transcriptional regulator
VTSLVGKSKLSQNREARDRLGAADTLAQRGRAELAARMRDAS